MTEKARYTLTYFDTPSEVVQVVQPLLDLYAPMIERLVDRITVTYVAALPEEDGAFEAAINVRREYRAADICITGYFLQGTELTRRQAIAHELSHILTDPLYDVALNVVDSFVEPGVQAYVLNELRKANELAVDDFSRIMVDLIAEKG